MRKRPIRQIREVTKTDWKPISLNQSQSVAKLASQGSRMKATNSAAAIPTTNFRKDLGRGGSRAGPGRSKGDVMCGSKCHADQPPATRPRRPACGGTVSAPYNFVH